MSGLPEFFKHTSEGLYDRHHYKVIDNIGNYAVVDNYHDVRVIWHYLPDDTKSSALVEVLDAPTRGKGF